MLTLLVLLAKLSRWASYLLAGVTIILAVVQDAFYPRIIGLTIVAFVLSIILVGIAKRVALRSALNEMFAAMEEEEEKA